MRGTAVIQNLLTELALLLLPRGMTPKRFSELARSAFVQAAADVSRFRNGRVNHSRVAALTGLTRADVKRLLERNVFVSNKRNQTAVERVIDGWRADREFAIQPGRAKRLRIVGPRGSFARLVKKYAGDLPHRAVLDELRRIGAVRDIDGAVQLRRSLHVRQRKDFEFLAPVLPVLVDGLRIAAKQDASGMSSIRRISIPAETESDLAIVRERCISNVQAMIASLVHSLSTKITVPRKGKTAAHFFTITVLLSETKRRSVHAS